MSFYYLASPYSKFPEGLEEAFKQAAEQAALLVAAGVSVYAPIVATHPLAIYGGLDPLDHELWLPVDEPFMNAAKGLIVCMMEGWESSYGVNYEIKKFVDAGKPVLYMTPGEVPEGVWE
jgi:hypothetical protein